jgi:predicted ester cyclase
MSDYQAAKAVVRGFYEELDGGDERALGPVISRHVVPDYRFRGVHPFNELSGAEAVAATVWEPLRRALTPLQRREDVFMAGTSETDGQIWVCSMGHLMGLLDRPWLGIPATGKLVFLRYAEFHRVAGEQIVETGFFCDIIGVMKQVGLTPLPLQTGAEIIIPGPRTHDGLLFGPQPSALTARTLALVNQMKEDLVGSDEFASSGSELARTWQDGMLWFGPSGIGSTYTIARYQEQHQGPFSRNLRDVDFNGHVCRFAEGHFATWFGWPNLTMTSTGGFLGLPASAKRLDMRVVDVYRREGDRLAENWIFIDLLYWMLQQDVDVLERTCRIATAG